jgi:5-methylcytosine-specific restriction protein A
MRARVVVATDVDHEDGNAANNAPSNLRSLCHACHSRKTATQDRGFGNQGRGGSNLQK